MSEPYFDVTYRVGFGNLNAFFGAWLKRTWFDRTNRRRFLLYWAVIAALIGFGLRSMMTSRDFWRADLMVNLISGVLGGVVFLLYTAVIAFVLTQVLGPPLIYLTQAATFIFGPLRKRTSQLRADAAGIDKTTNGVAGQTKWRDFTDVVVTRKTVLLFTNRNCATIVPKSAFTTPAEAEAFAAFAHAQWTDARSVF